MIARDGRHSALGADDRCIDAELGAWLGVQHAVGIHEEIADAAVAQNFIDARSVAALRQPDALRSLAEMPGKLAAADLDLGADGVLIHIHQRHEAVRRAAGDDLELAGLEEAPEAMEQVVAVLIDEHMLRPVEPVMIHVSEVMKLGLPAS